MSGGLDGQRVLVTGAGGQLGGYLVPALRAMGANVTGTGSVAGGRPGVDETLDLRDETVIKTLVARLQPEVIINGAAFTDVDGAESQRSAATAINSVAPAVLAAAANDAGAYLVHVSTDFVFGDKSGAPFDERAEPSPRSAYGSTKREGEQAVLAANPRFAVARTAWLYGGAGKHFPRTVLNVIKSRGAIEVVADEVGNPTFAGDLAEALALLAAQRGAGVFHLVNEGAASRYELAAAVAAAAGQGPATVTPTTTAAFLAKYPLPAGRPADSRLLNQRGAALGITLRPWQAAVRHYAPRLAGEIFPAVGEDA